MVASYLAHDSESVFGLGWAPLGRSGLGWAWLILPGFTHVSLVSWWFGWVAWLIDGFSLGALVTVIHVMLVWAHSPGSQGSKSESESTRGLRFWTSTISLCQRKSQDQSRVEKKNLLPDLRSYCVTLLGCRYKEGKNVWPLFQSTILGL